MFFFARIATTLRPLHPPAHTPCGQALGGEVVVWVGRLVAADHPPVMPTPVVVPEAEGEARRRRIRGSGGDKRRKE